MAVTLFQIPNGVTVKDVDCIFPTLTVRSSYGSGSVMPCPKLCEIRGSQDEYILGSANSVNPVNFYEHKADTFPENTCSGWEGHICRAATPP